ncbi:MAG: nuclear transport factor 2 family protein [Phenylobacterium sp.]
MSWREPEIDSALAGPARDGEVLARASEFYRSLSEGNVAILRELLAADALFLTPWFGLQPATAALASLDCRRWPRLVVREIGLRRLGGVATVTSRLEGSNPEAQSPASGNHWAVDIWVPRLLGWRLAQHVCMPGLVDARPSQPGVRSPLRLRVPPPELLPGR